MENSNVCLSLLDDLRKDKFPIDSFYVISIYASSLKMQGNYSKSLLDSIVGNTSGFLLTTEYDNNWIRLTRDFFGILLEIILILPE